ncbi:MAG: Gfo/Idh/MocA family protein [Promethearchaeota archaeon]
MGQNEKNEKIKLGIIGFGHIGKIHADKIYNNPNAELVAVSKRSPLSNETTQSELLKNAQFFSNWEKLIESPSIDAVIIATPTHTHAEIAKYAAENKKHIFLEKPMARTIKECDEIIKSAKKNDVFLFVGHVLRFWPTYYVIKDYYEKNRSQLGELKFIRLQRLSSGPSWADWFFDVNISGGVVLDLSIHDIDYAIWLLNQKPKKVLCNIKSVKKGSYDVPAISETTLWFNSGEISCCRASWAEDESFPFTMKGKLIFENGLIEFNENKNPPIQIFGNFNQINLTPPKENGYANELNVFINHLINWKRGNLEKNNHQIVGGEEGKTAVSVCLAALSSAKKNKIIYLNDF